MPGVLGRLRRQRRLETRTGHDDHHSNGEEHRDESDDPGYRIHIKASPQSVWDAITKPEWTERRGPAGATITTLRPGGVYRGHWRARHEVRRRLAPTSLVDGEVIEADPPRKLVTPGAW